MIKIIIFILLINVCILTVSAEEWDSATFTLSMENPAAYKGDYMLEVLDFDGYGMAALNITRDGIFIGRASLQNNDTDWYYMDNGRFRLKSETITDRRIMPTFGSINSPLAKVTFATQKTPKNPTSVALSISTDKKEYLLDQEIIATIDVRNVGDTKANDIGFSFNSDGLLMEGSPQGFSLDDGEQKSLEVRFRIPPQSKASYNITVNASWSDTHGAGYFLEDSQAVQLKLPLEIRKSATCEVKLGKKAYVSLSVENVQTIPLRVSLSDALPISFTPVNGTITDNKTDLRWEFSLGRGERRVFTYQMIPSQAGAHRLPDAHAIYMWGGEEYTNSSKIENIILVYKGLSYQEQEFGKAPNATLPNVTLEPDIIEVSSGENFSKWVNESGFAQRDIKIKNDTLNVSIFIPKGTKILDASLTRLTIITIEETKPPKIPSNLIMVGETYYHLGPDGAKFDPFIKFNVPFNTSMTDSPSIYRNGAGNWNSLGGRVNGSRVDTNLSSFSVYAVFVESSQKVLLSVNIRPSISIEVTPSSMDFGELAPGQTSDGSNLMLKNKGGFSINVSAEVTNSSDGLFINGALLNDKLWSFYSALIPKNGDDKPVAKLHVPEDYAGAGSKEGRLMFWAERSKN
jgi:hypothetical protein